MGRCYGCGETMSESTRRAAIRLGYLGVKPKQTKYQKWGMIMQKQKSTKIVQKITQEKNKTLLYNGL